MIKKCRVNNHFGEFSTTNKTTTCDHCLLRIKKNRINWRKEHRDSYNKKQQLYRKKNFLKYQKKDRERQRSKSLKLKIKILNAYGGPVCVCCGETDIASLSVDHINNNGAAHRKSTGLKCVYHWINKNKFPPGFQILCHNCNHCKEYNHGRLPEWRKKPKINCYSLSEYITLCGAN